MSKSWIYVFIGGMMEIGWVSGLKHANVWWGWALTIAALAVSFELLIRASKQLPLGTVYAVFTGLGTGGTVIAEMLLFGEPFNWTKVLFIALLLGGVIGLKSITSEMGHDGDAAGKKGHGHDADTQSASKARGDQHGMG